MELKLVEKTFNLLDVFCLNRTFMELKQVVRETLGVVYVS